jgi:signal transduction histidine kinase
MPRSFKELPKKGNNSGTTIVLLLCPSNFQARHSIIGQALDMANSPTLRLLLGLLITLAAVAGFSSYTLFQLDKLRNLQTDTIDLNRHDSLLLVRVQGDINTIGLKLRDMRDMTGGPETQAIAQIREDLNRLRADLQESIDEEEKLDPVTRQADQHAELIKTLREFWQNSDDVFAAAKQGHAGIVKVLATTNLFARQEALAARVSKLLERNNEAEERADQKVAVIYDRVGRDIYAFLTATILAILITSLYLIYSNREIFDRMESLSRQRRILAARMISLQEEVLRSVSRELHDEFGQILTAVGTMLARAERKGLPPDSPFRAEVSEVREIVHNTLEKMRSLSQMLHPAVIDDYGLVKGLEWYADVFTKQAGIVTKVTIQGNPIRITGQPATHCFRIVQEALNNAAKHSGTKSALVEVIFSAETLTLKVKDFGRGIPQSKKPDKRGLGLIAMRERAELVGGKLDIRSDEGEGTTVTLDMPLDQTKRIFETGEEELTEAVGSKR